MPAGAGTSGMETPVNCPDGRVPGLRQAWARSPASFRSPRARIPRSQAWRRSPRAATLPAALRAGRCRASRSPSGSHRASVLLRSASSSGCAAPERSIKLWASGSMTGIVPRALHHERQFERRVGAVETRLAVPRRSRSRSGIDAEPANSEPHGRPFDANVFDGGGALGDLQVHAQRIVGRLAGAKFVAARERAALHALEQLLDVDAGDRALAADEARSTVQVRASARRRCRPNCRSQS